MKSIVKALSWRILGSGLSVVVILACTGDIQMATAVGVVDFLAKILAFVAHDQFWDYFWRRT